MDEVRQLCNMKIFVDTDDDVRLARRIKRDTIDRGRDVNGALGFIFRRVHIRSRRTRPYLFPPSGRGRVRVRTLFNRTPSIRSHARRGDRAVHEVRQAHV